MEEAHLVKEKEKQKQKEEIALVATRMARFFFFTLKNSSVLPNINV